MGPAFGPDPLGRGSSDFGGAPPSRASRPSRPPPFPPRRRGRRFDGRCENRKSSEGSTIRALEFGVWGSSSAAAASLSRESSLAISSEETISGSFGGSGFAGSGDRAGADGRFAYFARDSPG